MLCKPSSKRDTAVNEILIDSGRLFIMPLRMAELAQYMGHMERDDLQYATRVIMPELLICDERKYMFHTFWAGVHKETKEFVTEFLFHGEPVDGVVEIGYQTKPAFRNMGYMAETVRAMIKWARRRAEIQELQAICENDASERVVIKNNFMFKNNIWKLKL